MNGLNILNDLNPFESSPRQRTGGVEFLEKVDDLRVARQILDGAFHVFSEQRRWFFADEFFVFFVELRIAVHLGHGLTQNANSVFRSSWRQYRRCTDLPERADHRQ